MLHAPAEITVRGDAIVLSEAAARRLDSPIRSPGLAGMAADRGAPRRGK